jgi:ribonucleotide reductase alpha subunit
MAYNDIRRKNETMLSKVSKIIKRDGRTVDFDQEKLTDAIMRAAKTVGGSDRKEAEKVTVLIVDLLAKKEDIPTVEEAQDAVEKVLIECGHAKTAKAYILYRAKRAELREAAVEAAKNGDGEKTALLDMFAHKSKLASIIGYDRIEAYKNLLFYIKDAQKSGELPVHPDYLGKNELANNIYQKKYFLKDLNSKHIETRPEDVFARLAAFMAAVETTTEGQREWASRFYRSLYDGHFLPGGRVIAGGGDLYRLKTMANCFVSLINDDNIESIYQSAYECARTYSYGGGIGVDISVLRPKDSIVHNAADNSTGSVSFMELFSLTTGLIGQSGRRGALMLTLDIKHPDSPLFINVKKIPNWITNQIVEQCKWSGAFDDKLLREIERQVRENIQVRFANISLKVSDEFMQAVEEQNQYGENKILVYGKDKEVSSLGSAQGGAVHYSYGIPSKPIEKYQLLKTFDSVEELNGYLNESGMPSVTENDITARKRDMFGDLVLPQAGAEVDLAIKYAGDYMLYYNSKNTGEIKKLVKARTIWNSFVEGNYKTAEPGLIFWSTMSKYSPSNYVGRPIASTNPCVAADSLVSTSIGMERVDSIKAENIVVDKRAYKGVGDSDLLTVQYGCELVKPTKRFMTGYKDCYKLETKSGYEIVATPDHRILTAKGWKEMVEITEEDSILIQSGRGKFNTDKKLPFEVKNKIKGKNGRAYNLNLPTEWSRELGMLLGWTVGDGFFNESYHKVGLVFAEQDKEAKKIIKPIFEKYCNRKIKEVLYPNGCVQIRSSSKYVIDFLKKLGMKPAYENREVPATLFTATEDAVVGFLEGLFSSDGTIGMGDKSRNYIRLNSSSIKLIKQVQLLLLNLGIKSTVYDRSKKSLVFRYVNKQGEIIKYKTSGISYELNISKENAKRFMDRIIFAQTRNKEKYSLLKEFEFYKETFTDKVKSKEFVGKKEVWDITEPKSHSFIANGIVVHNCAEVPLEDGGACNLASLNLSRFVKKGYTDQAEVDWDGMKESTNLIVRFLDNVVTWNEILNPLEKQRKAASETRRLGLGVMGIADMLNQLGINYDSPEGIELLEKVGEMFTNVSYVASANIAEEKGPSPIFDYDAYSKGSFFKEALSEETKGIIRKKGLRNIAVLSIAPTGTISNIIKSYSVGNRNFIGVSGGIEPVFALFYTRRSESFGNKRFKVFHSTVEAYIHQHNLNEAAQNCSTAEDLKKILPEHFFRTAHVINPEKRVMLQGLWQKKIDHSISSTVNLSEDIEPETISDIYLDAWKHGLKGITIYREGSRYPILSVDTEKTEFQKIKENVLEVEIDGEKKTMKGDDVIGLPSGKLTTVYHALKDGSVKNENGKYVFSEVAAVEEKESLVVEEVKKEVKEESVDRSEVSASDMNLSLCPSCSKKTLKIENGCHSCLNADCGFSKCDI